MQRAASSSGEIRAVQENAGAVDHSRACLRIVSNTPPSLACSWYWNRDGSIVAAKAAIRRDSSPPSSSAPSEQHPWPRSGSGLEGCPDNLDPDARPMGSQKGLVKPPRHVSVSDFREGTLHIPRIRSLTRTRASRRRVVAIAVSQSCRQSSRHWTTLARHCSYRFRFGADQRGYSQDMTVPQPEPAPKPDIPDPEARERSPLSLEDDACPARDVEVISQGS